MVASLEKITAAAEAVNEWAKVVFPAMGEVQSLGFPPFAGTATKAPFDILGDTLRGTKGVIVDMFRHPDKVLAACDRLTQVALDWALKKPNRAGNPALLHAAAQGRRRLHERRAVPTRSTGRPSSASSTVWSSRA